MLFVFICFQPENIYILFPSLWTLLIILNILSIRALDILQTFASIHFSLWQKLMVCWKKCNNLTSFLERISIFLREAIPLSLIFIFSVLDISASVTLSLFSLTLRLQRLWNKLDNRKNSILYQRFFLNF